MGQACATCVMKHDSQPQSGTLHTRAAPAVTETLEQLRPTSKPTQVQHMTTPTPAPSAGQREGPYNTPAPRPPLPLQQLPEGLACDAPHPEHDLSGSTAARRRGRQATWSVDSWLCRHDHCIALLAVSATSMLGHAAHPFLLTHAIPQMVCTGTLLAGCPG
jgi:hypothetical protein